MHFNFCHFFYYTHMIVRHDIFYLCCIIIYVQILEIGYKGLLYILHLIIMICFDIDQDINEINPRNDNLNLLHSLDVKKIKILKTL